MKTWGIQQWNWKVTSTSRNPSPFIVELRERFAKASQKLSEVKELSAKSAGIEIGE